MESGELVENIYLNTAAWRSGSAFDSRSKGCMSKSRRGHFSYFSCPNVGSGEADF